MPQVGAERCGPRDRVDHAASHGLAKLAVDEPVEQRETQPQAERDLAARFDQLRMLHRHLGGLAEDLAAPGSLGFLLRGVVHLLEHPRHGQEEGRLEGCERRQQLPRVRLVADLDARVHAEHGDEAREDVRRGDEQESGCSTRRFQHVAECDGRVARELDEVRVRENASLRPSGRTGGVDEGGDVVAAGEVAPAFDLGVRHVDPGSRELVEVAQIDLPDVPDEGELRVDFVEFREVVGGLEDHGDRAGIAEVPVHLGRRGGLIDGHEYRTREPGGEVDERPFVAGLAHQADLVAGLDAGRDKTLREGDDLAEELCGSDVLPAAVLRKGEQGSIRRCGDSVDQQVGGVGLGVGGDNGGYIELLHR